MSTLRVGQAVQLEENGEQFRVLAIDSDDTCYAWLVGVDDPDKEAWALPSELWTGTMLRACSYCGADMGTKPCVQKQDGQVSHGICTACYKAQVWRLR